MKLHFLDSELLNTISASPLLLLLFSVCIIALNAFIVHFLVKRVLVRFIKVVIQRTENKWDDVLLESKFLDRFCHFVPAIVIYLLSQLLLNQFAFIQTFIISLVNAYMVVIVMLMLDSVLTSIHFWHQKSTRFEKLPIKSVIQIVKVVVYFLSFVVVLALVMNKSPWTFISGLGALTAVFLLVFKDALLGLVASFQLTAYDMVKVGDWIEMPKYGADGDVIDVNLTTVIVQNWDKTYSHIPTYALITDSFKNWRGMSETGARRLNRSIYINLNSVKRCDPEMLEHFKKIHLIAGYVREKEAHLSSINKNVMPHGSLINYRNQTNLGIFRAYLYAYLRKYPHLNQHMTILVRQLDPTEKGVPINIYAFANTTDWGEFESIQSDIFDHILSVISEFKLELFQLPTGKDIASFNRL